MMLAVGGHPLEHGLPGVDGHPLDQAVPGEKLEHPVDARSAGRHALFTQRVLDLYGAQGAGLAGQQLDHPLACATTLEPSPGKHLVHVLSPGDGRAGSHDLSVPRQGGEGENESQITDNETQSHL